MLGRVTVRLIVPEEKARWDTLIVERHYLGNARLVGRQLRYVAEVDGRWVALLGWNVAAYHLKAREQWIGWSVGQRVKGLKFVAQNSRFLLLAERGRSPNLASRVLALCTRRLAADWEAHFGHPVLAVESFVDPERFSGACYRAARWQALGRTQGYRRHARDFYQEDGRPKELWVRALDPRARRWLCAAAMPERLARHEDAVLHCPYGYAQYRSLWQKLNTLHDPRRGKLHWLASTLTISALATLCGARGTRAIADFASHLNQTQLRLLCAYSHKRTGRWRPPSEPTIRRVLKRVDGAQFDAALCQWMAENDQRALGALAADGKTIKGARAGDGRAVHLLSAVSHDSGRLVAQRPVAEKSNEIGALRPLLADVALDGVVVTCDAMHAQRDTARFLVQEKGADYLFTLKGNQPAVEEAARRRLDGAFPPSACAAVPMRRERPRAPGDP